MLHAAANGVRQVRQLAGVMHTTASEGPAAEFTGGGPALGTDAFVSSENDVPRSAS
jgi:hypothetical protein